MNRRELLGGCGVGMSLVAGCVSGDSADTEDDGDMDSTSDEADDWREAPDVGELTAESDDGIRFEADVHNHGTYSRPPVLTLTLTSAFDEPAQIGPFDGAYGPLSGSRIARSEGAPHVRLVGGSIVREAGCWTPEEPDPDAEFVTLEPGESLNGTLAVVPETLPEAPEEGSDRANCYRIGNYRAETTVSAFEDDTEPREGESIDEFALSLAFELA